MVAVAPCDLYLMNQTARFSFKDSIPLSSCEGSSFINTMEWVNSSFIGILNVPTCLRTFKLAEKINLEEDPKLNEPSREIQDTVREITGFKFYSSLSLPWADPRHIDFLPVVEGETTGWKNIDPTFTDIYQLTEYLPLDATRCVDS